MPRTPVPPLAGRLSRLPVPFCIDHMGHFPTSCGVEDEGFRTLVSLVRDGALTLGQLVAAEVVVTSSQFP